MDTVDLYPEWISPGEKILRVGDLVDYIDDPTEKPNFSLRRHYDFPCRVTKVVGKTRNGYTKVALEAPKKFQVAGVLIPLYDWHSSQCLKKITE